MAANNILAKMAVMISAQTAQFNSALQQSQKNLGSFGATVKSVAAGVGLAFGARELTQGIINTIGIISDFEKTMSEVKAITGATGKEFNDLENDAKRLGASTKFTATEVGKLQVAYGRLGFTTKEILDATSATLDLAAATGEDLAKSADVAGSTVRGFGLNAKETQRVVDVMAASFNQTALGLENFTESMKYVAPVANAAGATVEETTALLGTLADAGIRGSMAGTSLRKIFTDMTKDGRPLSERLAELAAKGITLQDSMDEVGRTAQTSLLILAKNTDKTNALAGAFKNVSGEAAKMARIMQDNLAGDVEKLSSAWEGLILKMSNTSSMRKVTQDLTGLLNLLSGSKDIDSELDQFAKSFMETGNEAVFKDFIKMISETRRELGKPIDIKIVEELAEKYKMNSVAAERFYQAVLEINTAMSFQEKAMDQFNQFAKRNGYTDMSKAVEDYKQRLYELILTEQIAKDKTDSWDKHHEEQIAMYYRVIKILSEYQSTLTKTTEVEPVTEKQIVSLQSLKNKLEELESAYDAAAVTDMARKTMLSDEIRLLKEKIAQLELIKKLTTGDAAFFDLTANVQFGKGVKTGGSFLDAMGLNAEDIQNKINSIRINWSNLKPPPDVTKAWIDIGPMISNAIVSISSSLGELIAGTNEEYRQAKKSLEGLQKGTAEYQQALERVEQTRPKIGKILLEELGKFMQAFGAALITMGVGKLAVDSFNPYLMIAGGVALVAGGAALAGAMRSRPGASGGSVSRTSSSGGESGSLGPLTSRGMEIQIGGEFKILGPDLIYIINRQRQLDGRTKG
jgi:uncharacterized protein YukE